MKHKQVDLNDFLIDFGENISERQRMIKSFKAKMDAKRSPLDKMADHINSSFGSNSFLVFNCIVFALWILINVNIIPGITPFDPFPFSLLTTAVSLEAIILSIFVLISQKRASRIDDLREEIHMQVNIISEQEITKLMKLMVLLLTKNGIDVSGDEELLRMLKPTDTGRIEKTIEKQISQSDAPLHQIFKHNT